MKFRLDFVTNSSSSSYCVMTVSLKGKPGISYEGDDGDMPLFQTPKNVKKSLEAITTVPQFAAFLQSCCTDLESASLFFDKVNTISDLQDVTDVSLEFGEFSSEDGDYYGGSFTYSFQTKAFKKRNKPDKSWLEDMFDMYGYGEE